MSRAFARECDGTLISETLLVGSVNESEAEVIGTAEFLSGIRPACAYVGTPTRPPACRDVVPPGNLALVRAYDVMSSRLERVELLPVYETGTFAPAQDPVDGLLAILAVHPMRDVAVRSYLENAGAGAGSLDGLIRDGRVDRIDYLGDTFFVRRPHSDPSGSQTETGRTTGPAR